MKNDSRFGFVRVATAQPEAKVANCFFNLEHHFSMMERAQKEGADVLLFPELSLTAYTVGVMFQQEALQQAALESLELLRNSGAKLFSGLLVVGCPLILDNALFNCAVLIQEGKYLGVVPKSFIPNYKEFVEKRWFAEAATAFSKQIMLGGEMVPFGTDLVFRAVNMRKLVVGVEICEDLWGPIPPSSLLALHGATLLLNLSASNELIGKAEYRKSLVIGQSAKCIAAYAYASCGTSESTTDVAFSGHCLIAENGLSLAESERFQLGDNFLVADVDIDRLVNDRLRTNSFNDTIRHFGLQREMREVYFRVAPSFAVMANKPDKKLRRYVDAIRLCRPITNVSTPAARKSSISRSAVWASAFHISIFPT